jgi:hypothetical protein
MSHATLRPYCQTPEDLYDLLGRLQVLAVQSIGYRVAACLGCLALGLIFSGAIGKTALCLAVVAGLSCIWAIADHVVRDALMHLVSLHDVMRPRSAADLVAAAFMAEAQADRTEEEGANGQA